MAKWLLVFSHLLAKIVVKTNIASCEEEHVINQGCFKELRMFRQLLNHILI